MFLVTRYVPQQISLTVSRTVTVVETLCNGCFTSLVSSPYDGTYARHTLAPAGAECQACAAAPRKKVRA